MHKKLRLKGQLQMDFERHCWAEIDLDALQSNFNFVKQKVNNIPIMAVVKANGYGHDAVTVSKLFDEAGAAWFGVSCLQEALELRRAGINKNILILGYTMPEYAHILAENNLVQTVNCLQYAEMLNNICAKKNIEITVHIKVDTGMGRLGFLVCDDIKSATKEILHVCNMKHLNAEGLFTHFASADSLEENDLDYTKNQYKLLCKTQDMLAAGGKAFSYIHCSNSAGIISSQQYHCDIVRAGIILYGESPSQELKQNLKNAVQLKAVVSQVKHIKIGDYLSYGRTFCAKSNMKVATVCAGYADGYPRLMSGRGIVSVNGNKAKVLGRVCMDQLMVDVTDIDDVNIGDTAVLFGDGIADDATRIADVCGTINYEILTSIGHRVPKVYVKNGKEIQIINYLGGRDNEQK